MQATSKNYIKRSCDLITARATTAFTVVELLIVVVVIAVLAAVTVVAYNGISAQAKEATLKSDLASAAKQIQVKRVESGTFPASKADIKKSDVTTFLEYAYNNATNTFCLEATSTQLAGRIFFIEEGGSVQEGSCPLAPISNGAPIQTINSSNCPTERTRAVDARDNHSYWVKRLGDGRCWMLTSLGYAGGGADTYGDAKTLADGTGGLLTLTAANYYVIPSTVNYTTEPTNPSTATNGTGQYGYLYNWCAAMGDQQGTGACMAATTAYSTGVSLCPAGWRLPSGNGGELTALNGAINGGLTNTDLGLRNEWLVQRSGDWFDAFGSQGSYGSYWSSTQNTATYSYGLDSTGSSVSLTGSYNKGYGFAVRCTAI